MEINPVSTSDAWSLRLTQASTWSSEHIGPAGEYGRIPPQYTETFSDHAVCCLADLPYIQTKRVYVLHTASQSWGGKHSLHRAVPELVVDIALPHLPHWKAERGGASIQSDRQHKTYRLKYTPGQKRFQIYNRPDTGIKKKNLNKSLCLKNGHGLKKERRKKQAVMD